MAANYSHNNRTDGTTLTASIYNSDHQNHIDNSVPDIIDDYSADVAEMQSVVDPYPGSSESQATSLAGELERLRYVLKEMHGGANWYEDTGQLAALGSANTFTDVQTLNEAQLTIIQDITADTDVFLEFQDNTPTRKWTFSVDDDAATTNSLIIADADDDIVMEIEQDAGRINVTSTDITFDGTSVKNAGGRGALVYKSATQSINNLTNTIVTFNTEDYDTDSIHSTVTNTSRLTVPSGVTKVRLTAKASWAINVTGTRYASFAKNGGFTYVGLQESTLTANLSFNPTNNLVSPVLEVIAGDYFELNVQQNSGGALNIEGTTNETFFAMEIIA